MSLTQLGQSSQYPQTYEPTILETFANQNPGQDLWVSFVCTEFTAICPITGQPDFAKIFINYIPDQTLVESKALKLYLFSFRNHGAFHENCVQTICQDLNKLMQPKFLEVIGQFTPRGGISIFPYAAVACAQEPYQRLYRERLTHYSPGKYSLPLERVYT